MEEETYTKIIQNPDTYNKEQRIQAAFKIETATKNETIQALCKALETDPSPIVRHEYAFSLGECAHPDLARPALKKAIEKDENIFVRHEAILALATLGKEEDKEYIQQYLEDKDEEMRESAEIALLRIEQTGNK